MASKNKKNVFTLILGAVLKHKRTCSNFAKICTYFAQISLHFALILGDFTWIFTNSKLLGCGCTSASYTSGYIPHPP